jgi:flagellar biosynthesis/type III secretory pathway M-ring protein FliF/YscJ
MTEITPEEAVMYMTIGFMVIVGIWLIVLTYLVLKRQKKAAGVKPVEEASEKEEPEEEKAEEEETEEEEKTESEEEGSEEGEKEATEMLEDLAKE